MKRILVITCALPDELDFKAVRECASEHMVTSKIKKLWNTVTCRPDNEVILLCTGIGKSNSTEALMRTIHIAKDLNKNFEMTVLNVGTAASANIPVGSFVECDCFEDRDLLKIGYGDPSQYIVGQSDAAVWCSSGDSFVTSLDGADAYAPVRKVYDMEAFAQARLCQKYGVEFTCFKYITDKIGENSLSDWETQLPNARKSLTVMCLNAIRNFFDRKA